MMQKREYAVSPVVGVMLMLVVTIIIAAVVAAFASGVVGHTSKAPQASISATFTAPPNGNQSIFTNNGGDPFDLNDIRVVLQDESAGGSAPTKTSLTLEDNATSNCILFHKVGDTSSTVIRPGDSFVIVGAGVNYPAYNMEGIAYGHFAAMENDKITWSIVDKASGGTISTGTQIL